MKKSDLTKEEIIIRNKIIEYIKQLEKSYEHNEEFRYHPLNANTGMSYYYQGKADSIRATINDLNDILNGITYEERLDKVFSKGDRK